MLQYLLNFLFVVLTLTRSIYAVPLTTNDTLSGQSANISASIINGKVSGSLEHSIAVKPDTNGEQLAAVSDNVPPPGNNYEQSAYAGILTPDAFQQYVNQFGTTYAPYATYPAPVGYAISASQPSAPITPSLYPSPIIMQTGYEGFLVPTTTYTSVSDTSSKSTGPFTLLANVVSSIMISPIFRIFAAIAWAFGMAFFGSTILNAICNVTLLCKGASFIKSGATTEHGDILVDKFAPERVRRTAELVRNAFRKYHELKQVSTERDETG